MNTEKRTEILFRMGINQFKNLHNLRINNGHSIFKMNVDSLAVTLTDVEEVKVTNPNTGKTGTNLKIKHEPGYIYIPALNIKNAIKKFNKIVAYASYLTTIQKDDADQSHLLSLKGDEQINNTNP